MQPLCQWKMQRLSYQINCGYFETLRPEARLALSGHQMYDRLIVIQAVRWTDQPPATELGITQTKDSWRLGIWWRWQLHRWGVTVQYTAVRSIRSGEYVKVGLMDLPRPLSPCKGQPLIRGLLLMSSACNHSCRLVRSTAKITKNVKNVLLLNTEFKPVVDLPSETDAMRGTFAQGIVWSKTQKQKRMGRR